jgi:hypothetical protein
MVKAHNVEQRASNWTTTARVLETALSLQMSQQAFLVESIERIQYGLQP